MKEMKKMTIYYSDMKLDVVAVIDIWGFDPEFFEVTAKGGKVYIIRRSSVHRIHID